MAQSLLMQQKLQFTQQKTSYIIHLPNPNKDTTMKNSDKSCSAKPCCVGKYLLAAIPVFIFLMATGFLINHIWLKDLYMQTASLWRPMDEMSGMFPKIAAYQAILSVLLTALYKKCKNAECAPAEGDKKPCPRAKALCFGIVIGLLMGTMQGAAYIWMPIPLELAVKWFISGLVQGIGVALILSFTCCKK
jgi:hypothetical protein